MNRNVESHFATLPAAEISRSRFDRSQDLKFTFNVGDLVPFFVEEVLPGDTFDISTSKVVRLQTLLTPVMDNIYLDTYFFFVPNRLVWTHWKNFMGESTNAWIPETEYSVPIMSNYDSQDEVGSGAVKVGDALDYMGVPVNVSTPYGNTYVPSINALPYRAYQLIWNEWFRASDVQDSININFSDSTTLIRSEPRGCLQVNRYHDVFSSALPSPQKGPAVAVNINQLFGDSIPVQTGQNAHDASGYGLFGNRYASGNVQFTGNINTNSLSEQQTASMKMDAGENPYNHSSGFEPTNLYAKLASGGLTLGINDLRYAIQVQRFYEKLARGGSRYIEIIKSMFNVDSPDARMQRPEYLGGNRVPISIHQIVNQSQGESDFLGDLGAMSLTTDKHSDFVKSFTEHGFIIGLCCARYDHSYPQGLEKFWTRRTRFNYYFPVFANLGEEAVYKSELYFDGLSATDGGSIGQVFAYQERYYDYRYKPNRVSAEMRPGIQNTLASWHFADNYNQAPSLSSAWMKEGKAQVDRCLAVKSNIANQIFCDIYVKNYATRPMPMYSIPGLMDHH